MAVRYGVKLASPLSEAEIAIVALRAADELDVSILKLTRLLQQGPGMLTKPIGAEAAERVAGALRRAGADVTAEPVSWDELLLFEEAAQRRAVSPDVLASGEWPPKVVKERPPAPPMRPARQRSAGRQVAPWLLVLLLLVAVSFALLRGDRAMLSRVAAVPEAASGGAEAAQAALVERDDARALEAWQPLAAAGDAQAQYQLARLYSSGLGVMRDVAQAAEWYRRAAEQGHPGAQYELGWLYANGVGVARDLAQASAWYERAAARGHADAQYQLGLLALSPPAGTSSDTDPVVAARWFAAAAEQGHAEAQYRLGLLYLEGQGVARDPARAERWLLSANRQGVKEAKPYLAALEDAKAAGAPRVAEAEAAAADAVGERAEAEEPTPQLTVLEPTTDAPSAALAPALEVVPLPLDEVAPPSAHGDDLLAAAKRGDAEAVRAALAAGQGPDERDASGKTPLMYAVSAGSAAAVSALIAAGAELDAQSEAGWSPLMYAARDAPDLVPQLLLRGADPALRNADGQQAGDVLLRYHPERAPQLAGLF